ncbi:hypothetical protein F5887DRAFT_1079268 [Amanita rubescens]|nr:hypothetical protein F5887DRAFT_1079268 [Amanita rubescens]
MTRSWTTNIQRKFLDKRVDEFVKAKGGRTQLPSLAGCFAEWRTDNPDREPTSREIANAKSREAAVKIIENDMNKRLRAWFHNHTRGGSVVNTRGVLKIRTKSKVPQEWQEWKAFVEDWENENPDTQLPKTQFTFRNAFLQKRYAEESVEVVKQVKERREQLKLDAAQKTEAENQNEEYQRAIDKLPRTLLTIGENICNQTGWNITFLVGGPSPKEGGKIITYILNCGKTPTGKDYEAFLGDKAYGKHILDPFDTFLQKAFPQDIRDARRLDEDGSQEDDDDLEEACKEGVDAGSHGGPDSSGSNDGSLEKESDGTMDMAGDGQGEKTEVVKPRAKQGGKCEYELTKEANIRRNQEVLRQLKANFDESGPKSPASNLRKAAVSPSSSSTPVNVVTGNVVDHGSASVTRAAQGHDDVSRLRGGQSQPATLPGTRALAGAPSPAPAPGTTPSPAPAPGTPSPAPVPGTPLPESSDSYRTPDVGDNDKSPESPQPPAGAPATRFSDANARPASVGEESQPPRSRASAFSTSSHDNATITESQPAADRTPSLANDMSKLPPWLTNTGMVSYLRHRVSRESLWQELITTLLRFEALNPVTGKLPTTSRPDEVQAWIRNKKKDVPPTVDAQSYGATFMEWWKALQPSWRTRDNGVLSYKVPADENWSVLGKGGSAGIYTVVVALSWWMVASSPADSDSTSPVWAAVYDVQWVINQIVMKTISTGKGKKRTGNEGDHEAATAISKRYCPRLLVVIIY